VNLKTDIVEPAVSSDISDERCVERIKSGETELFEVLIRRHQKKIFNLVYRMIGDYDDASEAAQEVFLSAYKSIRQFRADAKFSTWLYRIALNQASVQRKSLTRRRQRTVSLLDSDPVDPAFKDPALSVVQREIQFQVHNAMKSLAPDHASVVLLIDMQGVSYEDAAQMLEIKIDTVKTRLHRARLALKTRLMALLRDRHFQ